MYGVRLVWMDMEWYKMSDWILVDWYMNSMSDWNVVERWHIGVNGLQVDDWLTDGRRKVNDCDMVSSILKTVGY